MRGKKWLILSVSLAVVFLASSTGVTRGSFVDLENSVGNTFQAWTSTEWVQTTQAEFNVGVLNQVDTSTSPGDVKLATGWSSTDYVYAFQGNGTNAFWRYSISGNSWTSLTDAPDKVDAGGALSYDGNNYVYAFQGGDVKSFWRYDISANSWTSLADAPGKVKNGGALTHDGNGYVYALQGNGLKDFLRYDISANSWTSLADAPNAVSGGGALSHDGNDYVYAFQGDGTNAFWRYSTSGNSWTSLANAPGSVKFGGALTIEKGGTSYLDSGTIASQVLDTEVAGASWDALFWDETLPSNTDITFEVRASDTQFDKGDATPDWTDLGAADSPITSGLPSGRYMQWRATLTTSDTSKTPTLHEVRAYYY